MSLIIKVGGVESTSFITVAEAGVLLEALPDDTREWDDLEEQEKEYRLELAAQALDTLPLRGRRAYCNQGLCFPRTVQLVHHMIPNEVKTAQAFIAYAVIHRGLAARPELTSEASTGARVSRVSLGGLLSVSFAATGVSSGSSLDKLIRSSQFPVYIGLIKWLSQVRGGSVPAEDEVSCSTTTTSTTTTTT